MKFVKTIYEHEKGGMRVTPFGTIRFGREGVCAIQDDELAIKVANCSQSLVLADLSEDEQKAILANLQAEDVEKNKLPDLDAIGSFVASRDNGVAVESTEYESAKQIGVPAEDALNPVNETGAFTPSTESATEAPLIGAPVNETGAGGLLDKDGKPLSTTTAPVAPVAPAPESKSTTEGGANSDELIKSQLAEFDIPDIKEMLTAAKVDGRKFSKVEDKDKLIEIAVQEKIM